MALSKETRDLLENNDSDKNGSKPSTSFDSIPTEIRQKIFVLAVGDLEDPDIRYFPPPGERRNNPVVQQVKLVQIESAHKKCLESSKTINQLQLVCRRFHADMAFVIKRYISQLSALSTQYQLCNIPDQIDCYLLEKMTSAHWLALYRDPTIYAREMPVFRAYKAYSVWLEMEYTRVTRLTILMGVNGMQPNLRFYRIAKMLRRKLEEEKERPRGEVIVRRSIRNRARSHRGVRVMKRVTSTEVERRQQYIVALQYRRGYH
ncbi:hypothetical protein NA57DRAFT_81498 [Rhizodiscina lignyota]|uniref:Uncharacterized protein n=1 Tax=Rhizodiscina lignyota TaxID=1504668 RepID=A0A9P4I577_9PEZI|nr:hypothetical protein NA57DRAFT_81498 [Rhizodiscina lignyota]